MPVTMHDVRRVLDPDEVDYDSAARLGPEALPHLLELVQSADPGIASKAAYLAGVIRGDQSEQIVALAAANDDARVRVAAASAASKLDSVAGSRVLGALILDADVGVKKYALLSVPADASAELRASVKDMSEVVADDSLRQIASDTLRRIK